MSSRSRAASQAAARRRLAARRDLGERAGAPTDDVVQLAQRVLQRARRARNG